MSLSVSRTVRLNSQMCPLPTLLSILSVTLHGFGGVRFCSPQSSGVVKQDCGPGSGMAVKTQQEAEFEPSRARGYAGRVHPGQLMQVLGNI